MPSVEYDLRYLNCGVEQLESYLLSREIYWPVGAQQPAGEPPYPQLTLGGLLLARQRLGASARSSGERAELSRVEKEMDAQHAHWQVSWGKKAAHEFRARLTLWGNFLEEYRQNEAANFDRYAYEASRRVMLHLLKANAEDIPAAELDLLAGLDQLLRAVLLTGDFIWEPILAPAFPPDPYWYLYGTLGRGTPD